MGDDLQPSTRRGHRRCTRRFDYPQTASELCHSKRARTRLREGVNTYIPKLSIAHPLNAVKQLASNIDAVAQLISFKSVEESLGADDVSCELWSVALMYTI